MTQFLSFSQRFAKFKSVRLQRAVKGVSGKGNDELHFLDPDANAKPHKKRKKSAGVGAGTFSIKLGGSDINNHTST